MEELVPLEVLPSLLQRERSNVALTVLTDALYFVVVFFTSEIETQGLCMEASS